MKRISILLIVLAVLFIPTLGAQAVEAAQANWSGSVQPVAAAPAQPDAVAAQPPAVQVAVGLVAVLFGCLALAPLAAGAPDR